MPTVSKPTPLRLWGFVCTALGGLFVALGSLLTWVTATANGFPAQIAPRWVGTDIPEGKVCFVAGIVLLLGILLLRGMRSRPAKQAVAVILIVAGIVAFGVAGTVAVTVQSRYAGRAAVAAQIAAQEAILLADAEAKVPGSVSASLGIGVFMAVAGGMAGAIGGVLSLALVSRPEEAEADAAAEPGDAAAEPGDDSPPPDAD